MTQSSSLFLSLTHTDDQTDKHFYTDVTSLSLTHAQSPTLTKINIMSLSYSQSITHFNAYTYLHLVHTRLLSYLHISLSYLTHTPSNSESLLSEKLYLVTK